MCVCDWGGVKNDAGNRAHCHSGNSFVPAEAASIGIVDRLFTRIQTRESVSVNMSTFLIDTNQMATALKYSSERSLILVDEYGKVWSMFCCVFVFAWLCVCVCACVFVLLVFACACVCVCLRG